MIPGVSWELTETMKIEKLHTDLCHILHDRDEWQAVRSKKRKGEKEKTDESKNNNHEADTISQDSIVQSKQKKKKRKLTLNEVSNDNINTDISKEALDEDVKIKNASSKRQLKQNNNHETDEIPQDSIIQNKQKKKKRKLTLYEASKDTINDTDILKEALDENVKSKKNSSKRKLKKNNNHETDKISEDSIVQSKQKKKKKKVTFNEASNDTINTDISKEASDADVKIKKDPSKRQLKKEKAAQAADKKKESRKSDVMQKALSYVSTWKHSRNEWKFEKLKQIWLMDNLLDENSVDDDLFPIVLEYFEGCKGMAREVLLRKGMEIIRKVEVETNEDDKKEIMKSTVYKRARELLQSLPTDK